MNVDYQSKIDAAEALVFKHNATLGDVPGARVDFEAFKTKLRTSGATSLEALKYCKWEDLERFGLPTFLARQVADVFRDRGDRVGEDAYVSDRRVARMSIEELLRAYDPREDNAVSKRLKEVAKDKPCIVFTNTGALLVDESKGLIQAIREGHDAIETTIVNGEPTKVYKVGERYGAFANENPLYPGRKLRPGDVCDQTLRSWENVPLEVRQVVYLAVSKSHEIRIENIDDAHDALDLVMSSDGAKKVRERCRNAYIHLQRLKETNQAPSLKIALGESVPRRRGDPLAVGQNQVF